MRGENGGLRRVWPAVKLGAQGFDLSSPLVDGIVEQSPLVVR